MLLCLWREQAMHSEMSIRFIEFKTELNIAKEVFASYCMYMFD